MTRRRNLPLWAVFVWAAVCMVVRAYPGGPPDTVCESMMPTHRGIAAQTAPSPFRVTLSRNTFTNAGETVTVTLDTSCGTAFKGFMLQARLGNTLNTLSIVGSFTTPLPAGTQLLNCAGDKKAVAHSNSNDKNNLAFEWTVPSGLTDHVVFVATFVRAFSEFYVPVYSEVLKYTGDNNLPNGTFPTPHECRVVGGITQDAECGSTKSCFSDCGTDGTCGFIASWKPEGDDVNFQLRAGVDTSREQWIGLGFSSDDKMGDDTVIECAVATETLMSVNHSRNNGRNNARLGGLGYTQISLEDNVLMCSLSVPKTDNPVFDFNTRYTLLFASGRTRSQSSTEKTKHTSLPVSSSEQADLTITTQSLSSQPASNVLVKAHGSLMISAWVFAASFGLVIARYYKKLGGSHRWCGLHIWFQIHRIAMVLTFTMASIAFIIIFADVRGYSEVGKGEDDLQFLQAHPILGIISTVLVVLNPLMALIRPKPDAPARPIFNWFHWGVGTSAWIISMVTIFIGFEIEKSGVPTYTKYVMAAFVAYQLLIELILELHGCLQKSEEKIDDYEMRNVNGTSEVARHSTMKSGSSGAGVFRCVLLVAHFFILLGFLIALLALVNFQMLRTAYNSL